ncbi:PspC domain-containing protein [Microbacterium bovistercoris]|uniref:PspC domain-containing protein n=1 Tax=Microbacterium bovistercoris TaxID=2293570 RepID=A0A371NYA7_9MICO|nr:MULTISPECIES: PspC domain-containing protein [Microbacterium]MVQ40729.1 PspC domain-containing protein [Microbacterium sp. MAH-37]REJ07862.1 PspC domain-containing protein [Microbacterium bovistercoris]
MSSALVRPRQGRIIAGVCAAVAHRFGFTPTTVRVLTVLLVLFAGLSLWAYILLWIVIPNEE